jgi:hypothetical protein
MTFYVFYRVRRQSIFFDEGHSQLPSIELNDKNPVTVPGSQDRAAGQK